MQQSGVHAAFGENFAKTKEMDAKFHRWLIDAFDKRVAGDYGVEKDIETDIAKHMINRAREFLGAVQTYIKKIGYLTLGAGVCLGALMPS